MNIGPFVQVFLLVLMRLAAIFMAAPVLSDRALPVMVRTALCFVLTLLVLPLVSIPARPVPWIVFSVQAWIQVALGFLQGLVFSVVLTAFQMIGDALDLSVGINMATVFDQSDTTPHAIFSVFFRIIGSLVFLSLDGHLWIIASILRSLQLVPPEKMVLPVQLVYAVLDQIGGAVALSVSMGLPLLAMLALADVAVMVLSRFLPQLQILQLSLGVKMLLALFTLLWLMPWVLERLTCHYQTAASVLVGGP